MASREEIIAEMKHRGMDVSKYENDASSSASAAENPSVSEKLGQSIAAALVKGAGMLGISPEQVERGTGAMARGLQGAVNKPFGSQPLGEMLQTVLGFGNGLTNVPVRAANTGSRAIARATGQEDNPFFNKLPTMQSGQGTDYNLGNMAGEGTAYAALSRLFGPLMGPEMLGGMSGLPGMAARQGARTAGAIGFGGSQDTENPLAGAAKGGVIQTGLDLVTKGVPGALKYLNTDKHLEGVLQNLSKGRSIEENAKSFAEKVKQTYGDIKNNASEMYAPVFDQYGKRKLYPKISNLEGYGATNPKVLKENPKLEQLHNAFMENPTLENAHKLQSDLGIKIRQLDKSGKGYADQNARDALEASQTAVKADIDRGLRNVDPAMADQYINATENYAKNVIPYHTDKNILGMAEGDLKNPEKIHHLFKSPEGDIAKIANDLGPEAHNQIMYDLLGRGRNITPEKALKDFEQAKNEGYEGFVHPDLQDAMSQLSFKHKGKYLAKLGSGAAVASSMLPGIGPMIAGGMLAGKLASGPKLVARAAKRPVKKVMPEKELTMMDILKGLGGTMKDTGLIIRGGAMGAPNEG